MPDNPAGPAAVAKASGALVLSVPLAGVVACAVGAYSLRTDVGPGTTWLFVTLLGGALAAVLARRLWVPHLQRWSEQLTERLDGSPESRVGTLIALASGAGLLAELSLVRWHASCFHLFGYFKNVSLLACFLGLGIGYALGHRRPVWLPAAWIGLCLQFGVLRLLRFSDIQDVLQNPVAENLTMGLSSARTTGHYLLTYGFLLAVFAFTVLTCVPLGHLAARLMRRIPALRAYGWNLAGSIGGVAIFAALARAWAPPAVWLLLIAAALAWFLAAIPSGGWRAAAVATTCGAMVVLLVPRSGVTETYSPYQVIARDTTAYGLPRVSVNNAYYQKIWDLRPPRGELQERVAAYYDLPYRLRPEPSRVLVVGSGTGNDVAAAIRGGARQVDAVEIDPAILRIGRQFHPERPYDDPRVHAIIADARRYFRTTDRRYDVVVYGLLDSHTLLAGQGGIRLDSYVYTVEGFREARARLAPDGILVLSFSVMDTSLVRKLQLMLSEAFDGVEPAALVTSYESGWTFVIGAGERAGWTLSAIDHGFIDASENVRRSELAADVSTDDWPFFYMPRRAYPRSYVVMMGALLAASALLLGGFVPGARGQMKAVPFLLGAGFMLVETKSITELALLFGSTWQVVSATIVGVLAMAFVANLAASRLRGCRLWPAWAALGATLAVTSALHLSSFTFAGGALVATVLATLPLCFSGFVFSGTLERVADVPAVVSSNLLGGMVGGLLEYNAMYWGFRSLYFLALAIYAAAFALSLRRRG